MDRHQNPYTPGAGARPPLLAGRESELEDFLRADDIVLAVPVDSPTMFLSFTAPLCTLETLAASIARLDPDRTYEQLELTGQFAAEQHLLLEPGPVTGSQAQDL